MELASNNPTSTPASTTEPPVLDGDFPTIYDALMPYYPSPCKETDEIYDKHKAVIKANTDRVDTAVFYA